MRGGERRGAPSFGAGSADACVQAGRGVEGRRVGYVPSDAVAWWRGKGPLVEYGFCGQRSCLRDG